MTENEIIVYIPIDKYDVIFEEWIVANKKHLDHFNFQKRMTEFDETLGLEFSGNVEEKDELEIRYPFKIKDGAKFLIAQIKHQF